MAGDASGGHAERRETPAARAAAALRLLLLAALALAALAGPLVRPAPAADDARCAAPVVDLAERLDAGGRAQVADAAGALAAATGAQVHVWLVERLETSSMDALEAQLRVRCTAWSRPGGTGRADDLVLVLVSFEPRRAGIWWGERFDQVLGAGAADVLRTGVLVPALQGGDTTAALVATLVATRQVLAAGSGDGSGAAATPAAADDAPDIARWAVPGAIVGVLGFVGLVLARAVRGGIAGGTGGGDGSTSSSWWSAGSADGGSGWGSSSGSSDGGGWSGGDSGGGGGDSGGGGDGGGSSGDW